MNKILHTEYGNASIDTKGYYRITSGKYVGKKLHRLIARDYFGDWIDDPEEPFDIHHIDGNRLNNCVLNLEPIRPDEHIRIHRTSKTHSDKTMIKISESRNTSGYFRVYKNKCKNCKQGFIWIYAYYEDGQRKTISSVSLKKLKEKVKSKSLEWREL